MLKYQRFLATSAGVGLLLGVVLIQAGIYRGIVSDALNLTIMLDTDMWIVQPGHFGPFTESSDLDGQVRELIARIPGVRNAESVMVTVGLAKVGGVFKRTDVLGYDIHRLQFPAELIAGRAPSHARYEVAVDQTLGAVLGERIDIRGREYTVVGIVKRAVGVSGPPLTFMSMLDSRDFTLKQAPGEIRRVRAAGGNPIVPNRISAVRVALEPWVDIERVREEIERWKHVDVISYDDQVANVIRNINRVRQTLLLFAIILVLAATAIIALTIYGLTTDKVREIATLKLIGAGNTVITGLVLWQAIAIGLTGYAVGNLFLASVKDFFPGYLELLLWDNLGIGVISVIACLVASIGAVRLALRVEPHQALGG